MISIQNVYHMLSYAFRVLNEEGYRRVETESFEHVEELYAAILIQGISTQLKRGLDRDYIAVTEKRASLRGKILIPASIKNGTIMNKQMVCTYDSFSVNSHMNRIIKSTMILLLRSNITKARKKELRKLLMYFNDVDKLDLSLVNWHFRFERNNQTYRMLIGICHLVVKGLLQTQTDGTVLLMDYADDQQQYRLFERFVYEYYRREFPDIKVSAAQIRWQLDTDVDELLPIMQSDIMMEYSNKILIIDTKYYSKTLQTRRERSTIHSANLYQIFSYVKNKQFEVGEQGSVSGVLLYANTDEEMQPNHEYTLSGNRIAAMTLDLNQDFESITRELDDLVEKYVLGQ